MKLVNNDVFEKGEPRITKCIVKKSAKWENASQELRTGKVYEIWEILWGTSVT